MEARGSTGSLELTNAIGMRMTVEVEANSPIEVMRTFGAMGWASGEPPDGGFVLPYCMADTFDWSLIGARGFMLAEGLHAVERLGIVWKRREFSENKAKKMPAKIAYSRGAKGSERDEAKEQKDDYVWLIQFVGGGRSIPQYCVPKKPAAEERRKAEMSPQAAVLGLKAEPGTARQDQLDAIKTLEANAHRDVRARSMQAALRITTTRPIKTRGELSEAEAEKFTTTLRETIQRLELEMTS